MLIHGNSTITLKDNFAIVFGEPGVDPSTSNTVNMDKRPIYVASGSTLNLNNANLIARVDSRNLKFLTFYYIAEDNGTVNGQFGDLKKEYFNPEVTVKWAGEDNGKNAAVEFGYVPGANSRSYGLNGIYDYLIRIFKYHFADYKSNSFKTTVPGNSSWDRYYDVDSVSYAKGIAGINAVVRLGNLCVALYGSARLEQAFGNNDVSVTNYLQNFPRYTSKENIPNTSVVGQGGVSFNLGRMIVDLDGRANFNADYQSYTERIAFKLKF